MLLKERWWRIRCAYWFWWIVRCPPRVAWDFACAGDYSPEYTPRESVEEELSYWEAD